MQAWAHSPSRAATYGRYHTPGCTALNTSQTGSGYFQPEHSAAMKVFRQQRKVQRD